MPTVYADLIKQINTKHRDAAASTPLVCELYRAQDDDGRMMLNAILGYEVMHGRRATPADEAEVHTILKGLLEKRTIT